MKITIVDSKKLSVLQEEFNTIFPYLKIVFFLKSHKPGGESAKEFMKHFNKSLGTFRTIKNTDKITIAPEMTVVDLEQKFYEVYGLGVQVFRKSGKVWLETTVTDGWTLQEQNFQGEDLSKPVAFQTRKADNNQLD